MLCNAANVTKKPPVPTAKEKSITAAANKNDQNFKLLESQIKCLNAKVIEQENKIHQDKKNYQDDIASRDAKIAELESKINSNTSVDNLVQSKFHENCCQLFILFPIISRYL